MTDSIFIEDIFLELVNSFEENNISFLKEDRSAVISFYNTLLSQQKITQNQANYILRILEKYKNISASLNFDYSINLEAPVWKDSFRVIDLSKKAFVETDSENIPWICLKFPYQLKNAFEKEILSSEDPEGRDYGNLWDKERKLRMLCLYDYNIIQVYDFIKRHNFEVDETFFEALALVEEIWQSQESVNRKCEIVNGRVQLINADADSTVWFEENSTGNLTNDLLLAKSMCYLLSSKPENPAQKIAGAKTNTFYTENYTNLFEITSNITGKVCIIIDRTVNALEWLKTLITHIDSNNLKKDEFKVCFRESNKENPEFNDWVKEHNLGGPIGNSKYLIFKHKPAKWLFNDINSVKIIITNNLYPSTNPLTRSWISVHPCVIYVDLIKPSNRSKNIVEL